MKCLFYEENFLVRLTPRINFTSFKRESAVSHSPASLAPFSFTNKNTLNSTSMNSTLMQYALHCASRICVNILAQKPSYLCKSCRKNVNEIEPWSTGECRGLTSGAKRKCNGSHSSSLFCFTNKNLPNFTNMYS